METAAKKRKSLALGVIASMIVLVSTLVLGSAASASSSSRTSPTTASPSHVVALKSRVEIFFASPGKSVELLAVNLANATRYYDCSWEVVLECLVAPVKGGQVLGQVDNVLMQRLQMGAEIPVPRGTTGIRTMMSDLSVVSGNEVALVRLANGNRVMTMGGPNAVQIPRTTSRVIAHTHPQGSLRLSAVDVRTLNRLEQRSTVLIAPRENIGVRVPVPQTGSR